ncbi:MAG: translation initiation factor IF-2 [archaeon]
MKCRSPIVTVLGHVDHGKSSILDAIRGSNIIAGEAGAITQAIGASIIPLEVVQKKCGKLLESLKMTFTIPGLLFIDTPGHAAFTSLRKRGGNLADIAIVVIDINEGFKPQTMETIEILKKYKTPFVVAANKLDLIPGYQKKTDFVLQDIESQSQATKEKIDQQIYKLVGELHEKFQLPSERFDRVDSYTKQIAIVPCSAKENLGIAELLMAITGMAQKYMEECLRCDIDGNAKGTILEVKEEKGLGLTVDVILYNGTLKVNDTIVIGSLEKPIVTKVRALLEPMPLAEMRDKKAKFKHVKQVFAATGVKISAPDFEGVISGMPIVSCKPEDLEKCKQCVQEEVEEVLIETDNEGIVIKADNLGSLEALINMLKERDIPIRSASVGHISKKDITDAESNYEKDPLKAVILGFNVKLEKGVPAEQVKILTNDVIYKLIEDYEKWTGEETKRLEEEKLEILVRPCKIELLQNCTFRQNNPAICGVEVLAGILKTNTPLMKADGRHLANVKSMQSESQNLQRLEKGKQAAVSMPGLTVGRQINEGDILYSDIPEEDFRKIKKLKHYLKKEEIDILKEIAEMHRRENPVWGV